jgi:acyl-CoA thioester hydrolase
VRSHRHSFRVIYGDTDTMGVVYYANYLRYFEAGRNEILRAMGIRYREMEQMGFMLPVAEASIKYRTPAHYDDELELETAIAEVRHASVRIAYRLFRKSDDALVATGETMHACMTKDGRVTRLPNLVRTMISAE